MAAVRDQSPDDDKIERMCGALSDASAEKGASLDEGDMGMIMDKFKNGGGTAPDMDAAPVDPEGDSPSSVGDESMAKGDVRGRGHGAQSPDGEGVRDDDYGDSASKYHGKAWHHEEEGDDDGEERDDGKSDQEYQEQDKAEGDGEEAGPEGGDEHEGKTKLMDRKGRKSDEDGDGDIDSDDWKIKRDKKIKQARKDKQARKYAETKGDKKGKSIKPVSANTSKGSGPGGGNTDNSGQEPLIPPHPKGSQRATPGTPMSKEGGGRTVKPVSESRIAVGMSPIGGTVRNTRDDEDGLTEDEKELRMIKRRAGLEDWWK